MSTFLQRLPATILLFLLPCCGCYSSPPMVLVQGEKPGQQSVSVTFGHAYFSTSATGEDQILLLHEPIDESSNEKPGEPLAPQIGPALNQVLRIQLLWRTAPAGTSDSAVADNAVIHWYVYGDAGDGGTSLINYVGTGAVSFSISDSIAKVTVHRSELKLVSSSGQLRDPFGRFQISGKFKAVTSPEQVRQIVDDLDRAAATPTATSATVPTTQPG